MELCVVCQDKEGLHKALASTADCIRKGVGVEVLLGLCIAGKQTL